VAVSVVGGTVRSDLCVKCVLGTLPQQSPLPLLSPLSHNTVSFLVSLPKCNGSRLSHFEIQLATSTDNGGLALSNSPTDELLWVPPPSVVIEGDNAPNTACIELGRHVWPSQSKLPPTTLRQLQPKRPYMECTVCDSVVPCVCHGLANEAGVFQVQGLPSGSSFITRVRFKNRRGWGEFSEVTAVCKLPSAHANSTAPPIAVMTSHNAVVVGWRRSLVHSDGSTITAFKLQYKRVRRERGAPNSSDTEPDSDVEAEDVDPWLVPPVTHDGLIPLEAAHSLCVPQSKHLFEAGEVDPLRMAARVSSADVPPLAVTEQTALDFAWIIGGLLPGAQYVVRLAVVTATGCSEFLTALHPVSTSGEFVAHRLD
jgi:hypothetical protein